MCFGGSSTQTTNSNTNTSANSLQEFINAIVSKQNQTQTGTSTDTGTQTGSQTQQQQTSGTSGAHLTGTAGEDLGQTGNYFKGLMDNGISPDVFNRTMAGVDVGAHRTINDLVNRLGPASSNVGGLTEDLGNQAIMARADAAAGLGAQDQNMRTQGAQLFQGNTQLKNPLEYFQTGNGTNTGTTSGTSTGNKSITGTTDTTSTTGSTGAQTNAATGTQNTNSTTQVSQNPGFGSILGSLLSAYAGIATGGAAGQGGLGNILGKL